VSFLGILAELWRGVGYTLLVTLACAATGMALALAVTALRRLAPPPVGAILTAFTYVFRGVPVLVLLFLAYFGLPGIGLKVSPLAAMVLSLGLVAGAYLSEVFRGALASIDPTEVMAAEASGLSRLQTLVHVEVPQMLRFSVPGMVNELTTILKYSPFAYTVGIPEITKQAMTLTATSLRGLEIYLALGLVYFAIYRLLLAGVQLLERSFRVPGLSAGQD
jgi:polar amino acid transport system permease protein